MRLAAGERKDKRLVTGCISNSNPGVITHLPAGPQGRLAASDIRDGEPASYPTNPHTQKHHTASYLPRRRPGPRRDRSSRQECLLGGRKLAAIIAAREQVAVGIRGHLNRGVAKPSLHHLERQLEAAIDAAVDAPRGVEVAQGVQALVFRTAMLIDDTGGDLHRMQPALNNGVAMLDIAAAADKYDALVVLRTGDTVL